VSMRAGSLGTVWVLESPDGKGFMTRGGFEDASNPVFARPPMPEDAPGYESMIAGQTALAKAFVTWLDTLPYEQRHNQGVVTRKINSTAIADWLRINTDLLGIFIQYRDTNGSMRTRIQGKDFDAMVALARDLATMPEIKPAVPASTSTMTAKGNPLIDEALLADLGLIREVFGRWKYRYAVGSQQSQAAQAQQEQARAYAARLQDQSQARIRLLESDLQDATKTVSDMLDNNWRQQP
jgi:hypothetical protein